MNRKQTTVSAAVLSSGRKSMQQALFSGSASEKIKRRSLEFNELIRQLRFTFILLQKRGKKDE